MNIYLVRHGQSEQNANKNYFCSNDEIIPLTEKGIEQAKEAGIFLSKLPLGKTLIISSPYVRAKQTASEIAKLTNLKTIKYDNKLQEFKRGIFGNYTFEECSKIFPEEFSEFKRQLKSKDKFYARPPEGESAYDLCLKLAPYKSILDKLKNANYDSIIIVSHSGAIRSMLCSLMEYDKEWYYNEPNMQNCSIRHLKLEENFQDFGYIHKGYKIQRNNSSNNENSLTM